MTCLRLLILLGLLSCKAKAQYALHSSFCFGGNNNDGLHRLTATPDGGFLFAGFTFSTNQQVSGQHGNSDMWVVKCDSNGTIQWQRCLGGTEFEGAYGLLAQDSGFIVGGYASSTNGNVNGLLGADDFWLMRLRPNGNVQWKKCFGGSYVDQLRDVISTSDGGYLMAGFTFSDDGDVSGLHGAVNTWADAWIVKLDAQRNILWQRCWGGSDADAAYKAVELTDGSYVVAAMANSTDGDIVNTKGNRDIWLLHFDSSGTLLKQMNFGGSFDEAPNELMVNSRGNLVVCGYSFSNDVDLTGNYFNGQTNWEDVWVFETDTAFQLIQQRNLGGTLSDVGRKMKELNDGYLLAAESGSADFDKSQSLGFKDYWLVKLDTAFNIVWEQSLGGNFQDFPFDMDVDTRQRLLLGGFTASQNQCMLGNSDILLMRLDTASTSTALEMPAKTEELRVRYEEESQSLIIQVAKGANVPLAARLYSTSAQLLLQLKTVCAESLCRIPLPALSTGLYLLDLQSTTQRIAFRFMLR